MKVGQRYLKIENYGTCPVQAFTVLGVSLADTCVDETKRHLLAGQFGSGCKYSIALLLRQGLNPIIFLNQLKMEYFVENNTVTDSLSSKEVRRICVNYSGKGEDGKNKKTTEKLGMTTDFGKLNWENVSLALREFVTNSIDFSIRQSGNWDQVTVEVVDSNQVRAKSGYTRVFIPLNQEVEKFYFNLGKWFLHFSEPESLMKTVLEKKNRNMGDKNLACIYRRGVFVRNCEAQEESLFDYNLRDLPLDESRISDNWQVKYYSGCALAKSEDVNIQKTFLKNIRNENWENSFDQYSWQNLTDESKGIWKGSYEKLYPEQVLCTGQYAERVLRKGNLVNIVDENMFATLSSFGVRTHIDILSQNEKDGLDIFEPSNEMVATLNGIWSFLTRNHLTRGKDKCPIYSFASGMDGGATVTGFYRDGVIYIKNTQTGKELFKTIIEEVTHYCTNGSTDCSRDFQEYLLDIILSLNSEMEAVTI